jgi:hypothetical protein
MAFLFPSGEIVLFCCSFFLASLTFEMSLEVERGATGAAAELVCLNYRVPSSSLW